jgi:hypothetical protein
VRQSPIEKELEKVEIDRLTPLQALIKLNELKEMVNKNS